MKLKEGAVRYLTKAEFKASLRVEHRERLALQERVKRGELTPEEANSEAAIIKEPEKAQLLNLREHLDAMAKLHPVSYVRASRKHDGGRRKKTIRAS